MDERAGMSEQDLEEELRTRARNIRYEIARLMIDEPNLMRAQILGLARAALEVYEYSMPTKDSGDG